MRVSLSRPLTIREVSDMTSGIPLSLPEDTIVYGVATDSREALPQDLFFALDGRGASGEAFIRDALLRDAIPVTSQRINGCILTDSPRTALTRLASGYKAGMAELSHTIAITGSNGKTTSKNILSALLSENYRVHATKGNYNNDLGVALTLLSAPYDTEVMVVELGMNHIGEISALSRIIRPTAAIITNIGTAHIGLLGSRERIAEAKREIVDGMSGGAVFVNAEEPLLSDIEGRQSASFTDKSADLYASVRNIDGGYSLDVIWRGEIYRDLRLNTTGRHILADFLLCLGVSLYVGIDAHTLRERCKRLHGGLYRHKVIDVGDYLILDDSYNSSLESITADLEMLGSFGERPRGAALGDTLELGKAGERIHRLIGERAYSGGVSRLYLFGEYAEQIALGAISAGMCREDIFIAKSLQMLAEIIQMNHRKDEIILFKASHAVGLDEAIRILKG